MCSTKGLPEGKPPYITAQGLFVTDCIFLRILKSLSLENTTIQSPSLIFLKSPSRLSGRGTSGERRSYLHTCRQRETEWCGCLCLCLCVCVRACVCVCVCVCVRVCVRPLCGLLCSQASGGQEEGHSHGHRDESLVQEDLQSTHTVHCVHLHTHVHVYTHLSLSMMVGNLFLLHHILTCMYTV